MNMPTPDRFAEFYRAVHGFGPFPWQSGWRRVCAAATGLVHRSADGRGQDRVPRHCRVRVGVPGQERPSPHFLCGGSANCRRSGVATREELGKDMLENAEAGILKDVADSLRDIAQGKRPLDVYRSPRRHVPRNGLGTVPLQPTIIATTVDQVGIAAPVPRIRRIRFDEADSRRAGRQRCDYLARRSPLLETVRSNDAICRDVSDMGRRGEPAAIQVRVYHRDTRRRFAGRSDRTGRSGRSPT